MLIIGVNAVIMRVIGKLEQKKMRPSGIARMGWRVLRSFTEFAPFVGLLSSCRFVLWFLLYLLLCTIIHFVLSYILHVSSDAVYLTYLWCLVISRVVPIASFEGQCLMHYLWKDVKITMQLVIRALL